MIIDSSIIKDPIAFRKLIDKENVGFFDFGCSHGEGTLWVQSKTDTLGIGFDVNPRKLALADAKGVRCCRYDILKLPQEKHVQFTTIFHMLEHLSSVNEAQVFITKACSISHANVYIKQPYYDADPWLFHKGFKTFYSHWTGHRNQMTTPDFYYCLQDLRTKKVISDYIIGYKFPITNSDSDKIHSLASPKDSLHYDLVNHPPKTCGVVFDYPIYYEIQIAIIINGNGPGNLWEFFAPDHIAFDSRKNYFKSPFDGWNKIINEKEKLNSPEEWNKSKNRLKILQYLKHFKKNWLKNSRR